MKAGNRAKYEQNPDLMQKLLDTGDAIIEEASPKDDIWGIGINETTARKTDPKDLPGKDYLARH